MPRAGWNGKLQVWLYVDSRATLDDFVRTDDQIRSLGGVAVLRLDEPPSVGVRADGWRCAPRRPR